MGFRLRGYHPLWPDFPVGSPNRPDTTSESRNPRKQALWFGLLRFRSPLLTQCHRFLFLQVLRCFTSLGVASTDYVFIREWPPMKVVGLPHSEISGSKPVDGSPKLIAVFRVLHSLLMPRHPSCARIRLARNFYLAQTTLRSSISYMSCNSLKFPTVGFQRSKDPFERMLEKTVGCLRSRL